ncbi:MAG TPA: NAD(P)H-hydrate dehydratase [Phycisphaerales bacterium]|nr:NAD(P)H-hydrate dehydratase [Phycisphaerales bacterium]
MTNQRIDALPPLPARPDDGHKGTFGTVAIVGGAAGMHHDDEFEPTMLGAPALAAMGAIRSGCGLVKIAAPAPIIEQVLTLAPFATGYGLEVDHARTTIAAHAAPVLDELCMTCSVVVAGMGMGNSHATGQIITRLLAQEDCPVVIDADGLNALCDLPGFDRDLRASAVLTPHPGEAKRLLAALSIEADPAGDEAQRIDACTRLAQRLGCVIALKGKGTVVSDGHRVWVCERGTPALAAGGTGDVLAGVIGSIIAQTRQEPAIDLLHAAALGVQAHALAGQSWAKSHHDEGGLIASELGDLFPEVMHTLRK